MHTTAEISKLAESTRPDQFIPVRKEDLFSALIKQGDLADPAQRELFWRFARTLRQICHYEYSETLDRLRDDYYYFNPEVAGHAAADRAKSEYAYDDLIRSLDKVLKDANFDELPREDVADAHRKRTVPVEVKAEYDDFREVRFYKRGRHVEQLEVSKWFGMRRREVEIEVFDDIVLLVAMKTQAEIGSRRELRILLRQDLSRRAGDCRRHSHRIAAPAPPHRPSGSDAASRGVPRPARVTIAHRPLGFARRARIRGHGTPATSAAQRDQQIRASWNRAATKLREGVSNAGAFD